MSKDQQTRNLDPEDRGMNIDHPPRPGENAIHQEEVSDLDSEKTNADPPAHSVRNDIQHREVQNIEEEVNCGGTEPLIGDIMGNPRSELMFVGNTFRIRLPGCPQEQGYHEPEPLNFGSTKPII